MQEKVIPCADCDEAKQQLEDLGFEVRACTPVAARPGFCRIEFEPATPAPSPAAAPAAAPAQPAGTRPRKRTRRPR